MGNKSRQCTGIEQDLVLYWYGDLEEERKHQVHHHLGGCEECQKRLDSLSQTLDALSPEPMEWSHADSRRLSSRISDRIRRRRSPAPFRVAAMAAAAVVFALVLPWKSDLPIADLSENRAPSVTAEVEILEQMEFLQAMEMLEIMELLEEEEPLG